MEVGSDIDPDTVDADLVAVSAITPGIRRAYEIGDRLKKRGESIPSSARIVNICDIYDALRSKRPYKPAIDHLRTVEIITYGDSRNQPEHFDPVIFKAFKQNLQSFRTIFETYTA